MKWIKVGDELPVVGQDVLFVSDGDYSQVEVCYGHLMNADDGLWCDKEGIDTFGEWYECRHVTHWAYMPNPPKD